MNTERTQNKKCIKPASVQQFCCSLASAVAYLECGFALDETKLRGLSGGIYEADKNANREVRAMRTDAPPFSSGNAGY